MPSDQQDPLQSLITEILEDENRGKSVDRNALLSQHPEHADSLRDFFANQDRMKTAVEKEDPTLPPDRRGLNEPTIPPIRDSEEEATIPPQSDGDTPAMPPERPSYSQDATIGDEIRYFGEYELLEEIARGGMGVVFKARQINLNRIVALKMILAGQFAGEEEVQRFYTEAEAAAQLDHPGIVPIFEIGEHQGQHYFSMGYIDGESLAQKVADGPIPPREAAELVRKICDAMAYAHQRGVIHRDLKPANILIDRSGQPKVTDFGLAKKTQADSNLTGTGQILGTPAYMPPEQASGKANVGPLADVYSLGAILYCLLTGRPPFQAASPMDTLLQVLGREPVSPRQINSAIPVDLETICLKCLSKVPETRFNSAQSLGDEVGRFLREEPILSRPVSNLERTWRWSKRNPVIASLLATIALVVFLAFALVTFQWRSATTAKKETLRTLIDMYTATGLDTSKQGNDAEAALWFANAARLAKDDESRSDLSRARARMWQGRSPLPVRTLWLDGKAFDKFLIDPMGQMLAALTTDGDCTIWHFESSSKFLLATEVTSFAWSPDGSHVSIGTRDGSFRVVDIKNRHPQELRKFDDQVTAIAYSHDGHHIAVAGRALHLWSVEKNSFLSSEFEHSGQILSLAFSPDDQFLVAAYEDEKVRVFSRDDEGLLFKPTLKTLEHTLQIRSEVPEIEPLFSSQALILRNRSFSMTDLDQGTPLTFPRIGGSDTTAVAASPSTDLIFFGGHSPSGTWVRSRASEQLVESESTTSLAGSGALFFTSASFSADGEWLITGNNGGEAQLWSSTNTERHGPPILHTGVVRQTTFFPNGRLFVTAQRDGLIRVWDPDGYESMERVKIGLTGKLTSLKLSDDGELLLPTGSGDWWGTLRGTRIYDANSGRPSGAYLDTGGLLIDAAISPDKALVATISIRGPEESRRRQYVHISEFENELFVWNAQTGDCVLGPLPLPTQPGALAFHPTTNKIAVICLDGSTQFFDLSTGEVALTLEHGENDKLEYLRDSSMHRYQTLDGKILALGISQLKFVHGGRRMLTWGRFHQIYVWDLAHTNPRNHSIQQSSHVTEVCVSSDEQVIGAACRESVRFYDISDGHAVSDTLEHPDHVITLAMSPDGQLVVTTCLDGMVRVWDWKANSQVCPPFSFPEQLCTDAEFLPNGRFVLACGSDQSARVWEWCTGQPVTPLYQTPTDIRHWSITGQRIVITPSEFMAYVSGNASVLHNIPLDQLIDSGPLTVDDMALLSELAAGRRIEKGGLLKLSTQNWLDHWYQLVEQQGLPILK